MTPNPQTTQIFAFLVAIHIFVVSQRRDFKFGTQVGHSYSQHTDYKQSLKGAWIRHMTHFKFEGLQPYLRNAEARAVKFCTHVGFLKCYQKNKKSPLKGCGYGHVT